jgi:glycosyltransferase involved in cell wall biosynthesis
MSVFRDMTPAPVDPASAACEAPLVSVIVPTRDRPAFLTDALASVRRAAEQLGPRGDVELIVVDNSSTDEHRCASRMAACRYGARHIQLLQPGVSRARNLGLLNARGQYVVFLDDDDALLPEHLTTLVAAIDDHPSAAAVFGQLMMADEQLHPVYGPMPDPPYPTGHAFEYSLNTIIQWDAMLSRREVLVALDGFDEAIDFGEDWDLQLRMAAWHDIVGVEVPVCLIRQHPRPRMTYAAWKNMQRQCARVEWRNAFARSRERVPLRRRVFGRFRIRGRSAYNALVAAREALAAGQVNECRSFVYGAFHRSPVHTARHIAAFRDVFTAAATGRAH